jgi:hypothetical protein
MITRSKIYYTPFYIKMLMLPQSSKNIFFYENTKGNKWFSIDFSISEKPP